MSTRRPREKLIVTFRCRGSKQHAVVVRSRKITFLEIYQTAGEITQEHVLTELSVTIL